ncbi:Vegetative incompatibility protein HET-E-1 [Hypsizygus marmoreus]|uniref:Vegetative incompatibility protein HET-E-1 n=1 Tax=Hypsizygus marmoreus TaxID=39966 RepID=A0A369J978_HYPMA|nr:Vegetative incompatibility protein HET-E-1 [Hypsizygus marmoreus]
MAQMFQNASHTTVNGGEFYAIGRDYNIYQQSGELSGMAYASGAGFNSAKECLKGTRAEILQEILAWISSNDETIPRVFWLSGAAGTGKSAIAHTIASHFVYTTHPFSCVSFDRTFTADRRHEKLFSTIARDLANRSPQMKRALVDIIQEMTWLKMTQNVVQQWDHLLVRPATQLSTLGPVVIVIDALDESGPASSRSAILKILALRVQELPSNFRILVTSRPLSDIHKALFNSVHVESKFMTDIPEVKHDISSYIASQLADIDDLNDKMVSSLVDLSEGLFQWAFLACTWLTDLDQGGLSLSERFDDLLAVSSVKHNGGAKLPALDAMYLMILESHFDKTDLHIMARFQSVMGQILALLQPLSSSALNDLRQKSIEQNKRTANDVALIVRYMGSLLSGIYDPSIPIRPLHSSFHEFLTDPSRSGDFYVNASLQQEDLAFATVHTMMHGLCFNICDLESSYLYNSDVSDLQERIKQSISSALSYSCCYWAQHVYAAPFTLKLANEIKKLLNQCFLFWIEVLSLIQAIDMAPGALSLIQSWVETHDNYHENIWEFANVHKFLHMFGHRISQSTHNAHYDYIWEFANDAQKFLRMFGSMISQSTPHLYLSALAFAPKDSIIAKKFTSQFPKIVQIAVGYNTAWPASQAVLTGHSDFVRSVSFSPDGKHIVSGSDDKTVRIWNAKTGQAMGNALRRTCSLVAFSPDGTHIVSGSGDKTVRIWDSKTGQAIGKPLKGHTDWVESVAFSPDGKHIVSGSGDKAVRIWNAKTGQAMGILLKGHAHWVTSVAFSPDGKCIVLGSNDRTIRIWNAKTGQAMGTPLQGHTSSVRSVAFSSDGKHIVSGSGDKTVRIWNAKTGKATGTPLKGHSDWVTSVAFSSDGKLIATKLSEFGMQDGKTIGTPLEKGHSDRIRSVAFSPDRKCIISGSNDRTIRIWDAKTEKAMGTPIEGHTDSITSVAFSPNEKHIVSGSNNTIHLQIAERHNTHAISASNSSDSISFTSTQHLDWRDYIQIHHTGWISGPQRRLLLWVPHMHLAGLFRPRSKLIIGIRTTELDLSQLAHGTSWHNCYQPIKQDSTKA